MTIQEDIEELCKANEYMNYNNIRLVSADVDETIVELEVTKKSLNPYGLVHGGALYTMADCASGIAARRDGRRYVTLSGSLNFLRSGVEGDVVRAVGKVRHRGRTTAFVEVDIFDQNQRTLASGSFTFFCLNV